MVLRGASGSGKSTLLRLLLGFEVPDEGSVLFRGEMMTPEVARKVRKSVAFVGQSVELEPGKVEDAIAEVFSIRACGDPPSAEEVEKVLAELGLEKGMLAQQVKDLSGGERHRVGLAIAMLLGRSIFLLDEPTAALDAKLKSQVADLFLKNSDLTLLTVAHDPVWFEGRDVKLVNLP